MSCTETLVPVEYAEPVNSSDPSCGCYHWGHHGPDGEPCHHFDKCSNHELIEALGQQTERAKR